MRARLEPGTASEEWGAGTEAREGEIPLPSVGPGELGSLGRESDRGCSQSDGMGMYTRERRRKFPPSVPPALCVVCRGSRGIS